MQTVLVDEIVEDEEGNIEAIGRTKADAPEIDGVVYLADAEGLTPGDFVEVQIYDADGHDLWGGPPQDWVVNKSGIIGEGRSLSALSSKKSNVIGQRDGFFTAFRRLGVVAFKSI